MSKEEHRIYFCENGAILDTQFKDGEDVKDTLNRCFKKITDLEAKLAEKEKENELMAKTLKMTKFVEKEVNQDKISFAVEQLEKVKEYIKTNLMSFQKVPIIQEINNQIKQLKEME